MSYYPYYASYFNPTQNLNLYGHSLYRSTSPYMMTGPMLWSGHGMNSYARIYPDMSMASQIYARDGASKNGNGTMKTVLDAILSAVVKFDVTELLNSFANN